MKTDKFTIEILDDGTIKTSTDAVSLPNHANADQFLKEIARLAGGETTIKKKPKGPTPQKHEQTKTQNQ